MSADTSSIGKGILAGFVATVVLSALMVIKGMMGMMPELNVITMLGSMTGGGAVMGWIGHFVIGTILWGILYVLLYEYLPGKAHWQKGACCGAGHDADPAYHLRYCAGGGLRARADRAFSL